jgi:hypothetical protein
MKNTILLMLLSLSISNFCVAQSKKTATVYIERGGTKEEAKAHRAKLKIESEKQKLRSQAAKAASKAELAKYNEKLQREIKKAKERDAKNTIHLSPVKKPEDKVDNSYLYSKEYQEYSKKISKYTNLGYSETNARHMVMRDAQNKKNETAINNAVYNIAEILTSNKKSKDARKKRQAKKEYLSRKKKIEEEYEEDIRKINLKFAGPFSEGLAVSRSNSKYGYINSKGDEIIPRIFDWARPFSEGFAIVSIDDGSLDNQGVINKSGEIVILPKYYHITNFSYGLATVSRLVKKEDRVSSFSDEYNKYGIIDKYGNTIASMKYDEIGSFSEELIRVKLNGKYGYINKIGEVVIPFIYHKAKDFSNGKAKIILGEKEGFINNLGEFLNPTIYNFAGEYSDGLAEVRIGSHEYGDPPIYGYINKLKEVVIPLKYQGAGQFSEGIARVKLDGKWGFIDKEGDTVIPFKYDYVDDFVNGIAVAGIGSFGVRKYGMIDEKGNVIIPFEYGVLSYFHEGLAIASKDLNGKRGFINMKNKVTIPFKYDDVEYFKNGTSKVTMYDDLTGLFETVFYINKKGKCVRDCE